MDPSLVRMMTAISRSEVGHMWCARKWPVSKALHDVHNLNHLFLVSRNWMLLKHVCRSESTNSGCARCAGCAVLDARQASESGTPFLPAHVIQHSVHLRLFIP